jgi:hypothetical protein
MAMDKLSHIVFGLSGAKVGKIAIRLVQNWIDNNPEQMNLC